MRYQSARSAVTSFEIYCKYFYLLKQRSFTNLTKLYDWGSGKEHSKVAAEIQTHNFNCKVLFQLILHLYFWTDHHENYW